MNDVLYHAVGWMLLHSVWQISLIVIIVYLLLNSGWIKKPNHRFLSLATAITLIGLSALITFVIYYNPSLKSSLPGISQISPAHKSANHGFQARAFLLQWFDNNLIYLTIAWTSGFLVYAFKFIGSLAYLGMVRNKATEIMEPVLGELINSLLLRTGNRSRISVYVSDKILSPLTFGFYKVSIVFPVSYINHLTIEETEVILAHEISHIVRYDYLVNLFVSIIKTFFYFHPGIWWLNAKLEIEREKATDELACQLCQTNSLIYAKTLLKSQELSEVIKHEKEIQTKSNVLAIPFFRSNKHLLTRIEHILGKNAKHNSWFHRLITLLLFLGIFSFLSFTQIIIPRNGKMVHPVMEAQETSREEELLVSLSQDPAVEADSMTVTMTVRVETKPEKITDKEPSELPQDRIPVEEHSPEINHEIEVFVFPDKDDLEEIEIHSKFLKYGNKELRLDSIAEQERSIHFEKMLHKEAIFREFEKQRLLSDSLREAYLIIDEVESEFSVPHFPEDISWSRKDIKKLKKRKMKADSIGKKWLHRFHEHTLGDLTWEFLPEREKIMVPADSFIYQYKMDHHLLENLKMEGLEHIEEFRFRHFPVDENRIVKIVYIES